MDGIDNNVKEKNHYFNDSENVLSVSKISSFLSPEIKTFLSGKIFLYESLESTNKTAKEMILSGAGHGTIVIADYQTAGKGRYGKSFHSPPGHGIYISFILDPSFFSFSTPTLITAFAAVSVCEAIEVISDKSPQIKWVNDVFIGDKKICGILTESVIAPDASTALWMILGIGINFNTPISVFPEELRNSAGSIFINEKPQASRNHLTAELINRVFSVDYQYNEKKMLDIYKQKMFLIGKTVIISGGITSNVNESYEAVAVDIDDTGCLIVRKSNNELVSLSSGEVSSRLPV